jgi:hypothetical protein
MAAHSPVHKSPYPSIAVHIDPAQSFTFSVPREERGVHATYPVTAPPLGTHTPIRLSPNNTPVFHDELLRTPEHKIYPTYFQPVASPESPTPRVTKRENFLQLTSSIGDLGPAPVNLAPQVNPLLFS